MAYAGLLQHGLSRPPDPNPITRRPVPLITVATARNQHQSYQSSAPLSADKYGSTAHEVADKAHHTEQRSCSTSFSLRAWGAEIICFAIACIATSAIFIVLSRFRNRELPQWPQGITLNAIVAVLATIITANISYIVQSAISQLKWSHFRSVRAPLSDIDLYHDASRGTLGAFQLLGSMHGGILGSLGAATSLLVLLIAPFAQQIVGFQEVSISTDSLAAQYNAFTYADYLNGETPDDFVVTLPIKAAVYHGLFNEETTDDIGYHPDCLTGNCTYPDFSTLAFCASCEDMTPYMSQYCMDRAEASDSSLDCGWQLPNRAILNTSNTVFAMMPEFPEAGGTLPETYLVKLSFMGTELADAPFGNMNPWAMQCVLEVCVQTIRSNVTGGLTFERVIQTFRNNTVVDHTHDVQLPAVAYTTYIKPPNDDQIYTLDGGSVISIRNWFARLFEQGWSTRYNGTKGATTDPSAVINYTSVAGDGTLQVFDSDVVQAFYWDYYVYWTKNEGIDFLMKKIAKAMTVEVRATGQYYFTNPADSFVPGLAWSSATIVKVRWGYLALPVLVLVLVGVLLLGTIIQSRRLKVEVLKGSALASMIHGFKDRVRKELPKTGTLKEKKKAARDIRVSLSDDDGWQRLVKVE